MVARFQCFVWSKNDYTNRAVSTDLDLDLDLVYPLIGQFWQFLLTLTKALLMQMSRWFMRYGSNQEPVFKSVINNPLKYFPQVESLRKEQKYYIKNMINGKYLCNPSHRFWKEFNLSCLSTSKVSDEWKTRRRLHHCGGSPSSESWPESKTKLNSWTKSELQ